MILLKKALAILMAGLITIICALSVLAAWQTMTPLQTAGAILGGFLLIFAAVFLAWNIGDNEL